MSRSRHAYHSDGFDSDSLFTSPPPRSTRSVKFKQPPATSHYHEADYESEKMTRSWVKRLAATTAPPAHVQLDQSFQHPALVSIAKSQTPNRLRKRPSGSLAALKRPSTSSSIPISPIESSLLLSPASPPSVDSIYNQYYASSTYHQQQRQQAMSPLSRHSSLHSSSSATKLSARSQSVYSHTQGTPSTSTIASTAATSIASSSATPKRRLSSANWISTRSIDPSVLDKLAHPTPSSSSASPPNSSIAPGTTPQYLSALGSYLDGSVTPSSAGRSTLSKVSDPFNYASEKSREEQFPPPPMDLYKSKDRDSLERITMAKLDRHLPPLPSKGEKTSAPKASKARFADPPYTEASTKTERRKGRNTGILPPSAMKRPATAPSKLNDAALTDSEIAYLKPSPVEDAYVTDSGHPMPVPPKNPRRRRPTIDTIIVPSDQPEQYSPPPSAYKPPALSPVTPLRISKRNEPPAPPPANPPPAVPQPRSQMRPPRQQPPQAVLDMTRTFRSQEDVWNAVRALRMVLLDDDDYGAHIIDNRDDADNDAIMSLEALKRTVVW